MFFGINGFGRIGRALFRIAFKKSTNKCCYINEPYANIDDIIYFLKYDSLYGTFNARITKKSENTIQVSDDNNDLLVHVTFETSIESIINNYGESFPALIDSSGITTNIEYLLKNNDRLPCKIIITASNDLIENEIVFGVNEDRLLKTQNTNVFSASICDTVAIAPILNCIYSNFSVRDVLITTMHPALSYQKVVDNYTSKGINRSLGRQYIDSIITKKTSAEHVLKKLFGSNLSISCLSYRIPTESVCSADITIILNQNFTLDDIKKKLQIVSGEVISFSNDDLVSIDFKGSSSSAIIDLRWLQKINSNICKIVIWYDNEWGYSSRVNDLITSLEVKL